MRTVSKFRRLWWKITSFFNSLFQTLLVVLVLSTLVGACYGVRALQAHYVYGDWKCGFKNCVELR